MDGKLRVKRCVLQNHFRRVVTKFAAAALVRKLPDLVFPTFARKPRASTVGQQRASGVQRDVFHRLQIELLLNYDEVDLRGHGECDGAVCRLQRLRVGCLVWEYLQSSQRFNSTFTLHLTRNAEMPGL